ncbi:MAG: hypothetical protein JKY16_04155 [Lutibacter sp.]|nr:hypothetical protein [Lutibacter sp.]
MANSNKNIIKEIAENLDCGFICYYNSNTNEIVTIPNFSNISDKEEFKEIIQEDLEKVNKQKIDFVKFEVLESFESFKIMERFVEQISDKQFKSELENILQKKKPFQNFKYLIDNSDYRQKWYDFKQRELERIVENQLNR